MRTSNTDDQSIASARDEGNRLPKPLRFSRRTRVWIATLRLVLFLAMMLTGVSTVRADEADHTFRILGLFDRQRVPELRETIAGLDGIELVEVNYELGEVMFRFDATTALPGARKSESLVVSFDRVLRQASRSSFEALPRSQGSTKKQLPYTPSPHPALSPKGRGYMRQLFFRRSQLPHDQRKKVEIPIAGLDCRGCSYGAYLAVCKIEGVERAIAQMGESGMVTAWINPDKVTTADLEAGLIAKGVQTNYRLDEQNLVPPAEMSVVRCSSEEGTGGLKQLARNAIDGDPRTLWRTSHRGLPTPHPHELVIDLGRSRQIAGLRYLAAQFTMSGHFAQTEFYASDDPKTFDNDPVAKATLRNTRSPQSVNCPKPVAGRYVLIRILSAVDKTSVATAAEIGIVEAQSQRK